MVVQGGKAVYNRRTGTTAEGNRRCVRSVREPAHNGGTVVRKRGLAGRRL